MSAIPPSRPGVLDTCETWFDRALPMGLPRFPFGDEASNPLNSSPYLLSYTRFRSVAATWPGRERHLEKLDMIMARARKMGLAIDALLLGGSCLDLKLDHINDIDCVAFYRIFDEGLTGTGSSLTQFQKDARAEKVDIRLVPLDGDPLLTLKMASYFSLLYSNSKPTHASQRGIVLLDCRV